MLSAADHGVLTRTGKGTPTGGPFRRFWVPAQLESEVPEAGAPHRHANLYRGRNRANLYRCPNEEDGLEMPDAFFESGSGK